MKDREVYFIRAIIIGLIKIGTANFAAERFRVLKTASPDKLELLGVVLCRNYGSLEGELHMRFAEHRSHGEWYRPSSDLIEYIEKNVKAPCRNRDEAALTNSWDDIL